MARRPSTGTAPRTEQDVRDQEVLRANKELAAYFKGLRTEREARGALKIIEAFIRSRERQDARSRPPLPLPGPPPRGAKAGTNEKTRAKKTQKQRTPRRRIRREAPAETASNETSANVESSDSPSSDPSKSA